MKKILISTIVRNREATLDLWYKQLVELNEYVKHECDLYISVFENDSTDRSLSMLRNYDYSMFKGGEINSKTLNTTQYGSVWSEDRLARLAFYRQQTINAVNINNFDLIAMIEPDIQYDPKWAQELLRQYRLQPDIYSAWSLRSGKWPKECMYLYDTCATRQTADDLCWDFDLADKKCQLIDMEWAIFSCYSTFNCFCVYKAEPFKRGLKLSHINPRLVKNPSAPQPFRDNIDCDTVVTCELFRDMGYNNICFNRNVIVRHLD